MTSEQKKIADLQRLCERAYLVLEEHWGEYTDEEGFGPINLLSDLKKVADGEEYKELQNLNMHLMDRLIKAELNTPNARTQATIAAYKL